MKVKLKWLSFTNSKEVISVNEPWERRTCTPLKRVVRSDERLTQALTVIPSVGIVWLLVVFKAVYPEIIIHVGAKKIFGTVYIKA